MNFLAHLFLSGSDPDWRAGGFLGDFVRGPLRGRLPAGIERGIALHRHVDASSDQHPALRAAVAAFPAPYRRWAPVALDVLFDHFLARDFERWQPQSLEHFSLTCYRQLDDRRQHFNDPARRFLDRMAEVDLLTAYRQRSSVGRALSHLAVRARRNNPLASMDAVLAAREDALHTTFHSLLPDLLTRCAAWQPPSGESAPPKR